MHIELPVLSSLEDLAERYYDAGDFNRKSLDYLKSYERILQGRRNSPLAILEIGVGSGASLLVWRDYLPQAKIIGLDVAEPPPRILDQDRIHFVRGSQDDPATLETAARLAGGSFDVIIDDASHIGYLTKRAMHYLFPLRLAPGGWYVIEDFGTGFLPEFPDGVPYSAPDWTDAQPGTREFLGSQFGMVGVVKQLVDVIMQEKMAGPRHYMPIERLIIEPNIVFIEKSLMPGGAWPGHIRDLAWQAGQSIGSPSATVDELRTVTENHAARLGELERIIGRLRRVLAPALWLRRSLRR
jgi:SAM-dependent methyltransferase